MSASAGAASGANWRQQYINSNRADGAWIKVSRKTNGSFGGQLQVNGGKLMLPRRSFPALAAADVDRCGVFQMLWVWSETRHTLGSAVSWGGTLWGRLFYNR